MKFQSALSRALSLCFWLAFVAVTAFAALSVSAAAQTFTTIYTFTGGADGAYPGGLTLDSAGNLYGVAFSGGSPVCPLAYHGCGTIFKVSPAGKLTVLYRFTGGTDGAYPQSGVILDSANNLYGVTLIGGDPSCMEEALYGPGCGTVYKLDAAGHKSVLHAFTSVPDGAGPIGNLVLDSAGNIFGVTYIGGNCSDPTGCGTVFKLDASGDETQLFAFDGGPEGNGPFGLTQGSDGNFYGITAIGGVYFAGLAFKMDSSGNETVLHNFQGGAGDGQFPDAQLGFVGPHMYGSTEVGGFDFGTVYELDERGKEELVYRFFGPPDGTGPEGILAHDRSGNLYGATVSGGNGSSCMPPYGCGTVFRIDADRQEHVLYRFSGMDGASPMSGVVRDSAGNLYGTTNYGGAYGYGTIFKIIP